MKEKGFTLLEILVVVLIIGILAAIAVPKYQKATDKSRYSQLTLLTKAIVDAQLVAIMSGIEPNFNNLDISLPKGCSLNDERVYCEDKHLYCFINLNHSSNFYTRCEDTKLKITDMYTIRKETGNISQRDCYAHTMDLNDRANSLCKHITGSQTPFNDQIRTYTGYIAVKGYTFK